MRSGVLTSISSRQRSAISGRPFHERMGFAFLNNTALYIGVDYYYYGQKDVRSDDKLRVRLTEKLGFKTLTENR